MSAPQTANDLLFAGGGAPALQWAHPDTQQDYPVGTSYEGEVIKTSAVRQRDIKDKAKLAVWPDGQPKYVAIVTLATSLRDPQVEEDDGHRSLWVSGKYLTDAVKAAVRKTGSHEIEEGGWLKVTLTGYGKPQDGFRPPRLFDVVYRRPSPEKRAEIAARAAQQTPGWDQAGPMGDPSDPWSTPQNPFPPSPQGFGGPAPAADPWGGSPVPGVGHPAPQQYAQGGLLPSGAQSVANNTGAAIPVAPQPPVGGFTGTAKAAPPAGPTPEAQALIDRMYAQQQGGTNA